MTAATAIPEALMAGLSELVAAHMGLHFPPPRWPDLERGLRAVARDLGCEDVAHCAADLMAGPLTARQLDSLADCLTIGETYFMREPRSFEAFAGRVLPDLIAARRGGERRLRLWSAACCTGEEAYSLAVLIRRALPDIADWNVSILATDVNPRFLRRAAEGVFGEWSFRGVPGWLADGFFTAAGPKRFAILPEVRHMVRFEHLNLARDVFPSLLNDTNAMDVIFCRNVLMYFEPQQAARVLDGLYRCLVEGGWLVLSAAENPPAGGPPFQPVEMGGAILYRKTRGGPPPLPPPAAGDLARVAAAPRREAPRAPAPPAAAPPEPTPPPAPPPAAALAARARELAGLGRLDEAMLSADQAVAAAKLDPRAHYLRALILQERGARGEAAGEFQRAVYLDHGFVLAHFALGHLARQAGAAREAARHFENALRLLRRHRQDEILPESDGLTAGRLMDIIAATLAEEPPR